MSLLEDENTNKSSELADHGEATVLDKTTKASEQSSGSACRKELLVEDTYESSKPADHGKADELSNTRKAPVMHNTETDGSSLEDKIIDVDEVANEIGEASNVIISEHNKETESLNKSNIKRHDPVKNSTVVIGDSLLKGLRQHSITKATNTKVQVKCFPGAKLCDMKHYSIPPLAIDPKHIILHCGMNHLQNKSPQEITKETGELCDFIFANCPNADITVSSILTRKDSQVDIFTINETRLDESISDEEVNIKGYNLYRKDRCRSGGGVAIYTRDVLNAREMSQFVPKDIEAVCLKTVKHKTKPILVTSIYCPPNSKADFIRRTR
ncbi:Transposon Ty3-G Gag-Pol poly [Paramuricea clavata]|uniref:Transposon Ty3-G Gag-Pol poly n=1 Tax=Paramuricea clavata TaxID=317549 RepID=A0A7D9DJR2_PARCT|nr:Transposon Ty3-G Gag-Pol poly [Paramuricea clavata]